MNETNTKHLYDRFPDIFRDHDKPMTETCMCWGFEFDDGWHKILERLCEKLESISVLTGIHIVASQVKEKFGTGRFYYYTQGAEDTDEKELELWNDIIRNVVSHWENNECAQTCEITGEYGSLCQKDGWYKTLSDEKAKELGFERIGP